jgi:hypothetical protein
LPAARIDAPDAPRPQARYYRLRGDAADRDPPGWESGRIVGFLRRAPAANPERAVIDPVTLALAQLRHAGADPTVPHPTRHFIYVPGVKAAQHLARLLKNPKRQVEIDTSARKGYWLVVVRESMIVTPEALAALRTEFEGAAAPLGGDYDRWQVDVAGG